MYSIITTVCSEVAKQAATLNGQEYMYRHERDVTLPEVTAIYPCIFLVQFSLSIVQQHTFNLVQYQ